MPETTYTAADLELIIGTIAAHAEPGALAEVLLAGAEALLDDDGTASDAAHQLAGRIRNAGPTTPARFSIGDAVEMLNDHNQPSGYIGGIAERYINEKGEWEYTVRYGRHGARRDPYLERHLRPADDDAAATR